MRVRTILGLLLAMACGGDDLVLPAAGSPARIRIVSGNGQSGRVRERLPEPIVAQVTDTGDQPVEGVRVAFAFNGGAGTVVEPEEATTDADGRASVQLWLGASVGEGQGVAWVVRSEDPLLEASFTATALPAGTGAAAPTAANDAYSTLEGYDRTLTVAEPGVLANDDDHGTGPLRAGDASDPPNGKVALRQDGSFSYSPDPSYYGEDSFTYRVTDRRGVSSRGTVVITVLPVNDSPRFRIRGGDQVAPAGGGPQRVPGFAEVVSPGAPNEQGQALDFIVEVDPEGASHFSEPPAISTDGTLTYVPSGTKGRAVVTVRLRDNGGTANGGDDTSDPETFIITLS